jgi:hypothetical protein
MGGGGRVPRSGVLSFWERLQNGSRAGEERWARDATSKGGGGGAANLGASWGLLFCLLIDTWDRHTSETILVSNSLWLLAALSLSVACTVAVEYVFGARTPAEDLREQFILRYRLLATMYGMPRRDFHREAP